MLHLFYFITKRADLEAAAFSRYWRDTHGPIVQRIPQLRRYLQSHAISETPLSPSFDGAAEAWVDDAASLEALQQSAEYRDGALADEPNFIDMDRVAWMVTRDRVFLDAPQTENQVKTVSCIRRKAGMSVEEFREHWADVHAPIACALPGIERYVQSTTVDEAYKEGEPRWDGVGQIWLKDLDALAAMRESTAYTVDAAGDAAHFVEPSALSAFAAREFHVIWPGSDN